MRSGSCHQRGFVLILVLGALAVMSALVVGLNLRCRAAVDTSTAFRNAQQALNNAYSGLYTAMAHLTGPNNIAIHEYQLELTQGHCHFEIIPENGKLSLNTLLDAQQQPIPERVEQWVRLIDAFNRESKHPAFDYQMIPALADWTDKDDEILNLATISSHPTGSETYKIAGMSRPCPNRPVTHLAEIRWMSGMTTSLFNRLKIEVTVGTEDHVDLNQASETVLQALSEHVDPVLARVIADYRQLQPYKSMKDLARLPGMTPAAFKDLTRWGSVEIPAQMVQIRSQGVCNGIERTIEVQVQRNVSTQSVDVVHIKEI